MRTYTFISPALGCPSSCCLLVTMGRFQRFSALPGVSLRVKNPTGAPVGFANIFMDSFNSVPPHGVVRGWLGEQFVERLLVYAQSNEHLFKASRVASNRIDITRRISRRLDDLGDLKQELRAKVREL